MIVYYDVINIYETITNNIMGECFSLPDDINYQDPHRCNRTKLMRMCFRGKSDEEIMATIARHRKIYPNIPININLQDSSGHTLLMCALMYRKQSLIDMLLADKTLNIHLKDKYGHSAISHTSELHNFKRLAKMGFEYSGDVIRLFAYNIDALKYILEELKPFFNKDALIYVFKSLMSYGRDAFTANKNQCKVLEDYATTLYYTYLKHMDLTTIDYTTLLKAIPIQNTHNDLLQDINRNISKNPESMMIMMAQTMHKIERLEHSHSYSSYY